MVIKSASRCVCEEHLPRIYDVPLVHIRCASRAHHVLGKAAAERGLHIPGHTLLRREQYSVCELWYSREGVGPSHKTCVRACSLVYSFPSPGRAVAGCARAHRFEVLSSRAMAAEVTKRVEKREDRR